MTELIPEDKFVDRTGWPKGEWDGEPDRLDFAHAGFSCLLVRNPIGAWCGYVGVPEGHPAFKKDYDSVNVSVHGGLTYADVCTGNICHVPQPGMPEKVWWLGFDTIHAGDTAPGMLTFWKPENPSLFDRGVSYKNLAYTRQQTEQLAEQLEKGDS